MPPCSSQHRKDHYHRKKKFPTYTSQGLPGTDRKVDILTIMASMFGLSSNTFNPDSDIPELDGKVSITAPEMQIMIADRYLGLHRNGRFGWHWLRHRRAHSPTQPGEDIPPFE
jgi:hypothetical protein